MLKIKNKLLDSSLKKAVIVANGPSINDYNWDSFANLSNVIFISCNRISFLFEKTIWRPDIYICLTSASLSNPDWVKNIDECLKDKSIHSIVNKNFKKVSNLNMFHDNICFTKKVIEHSRHEKIVENFIAIPLAKGIVKSYSATASMFQVCDSLDIKEIAIIGQDGYNLKRGKNHFDKNYIDEATNFKKSNDRITKMNNEIKRYFSNKGVKIYNSSKNSILKSIYEYKDLNHFVKS